MAHHRLFSRRHRKLISLIIFLLTFTLWYGQNHGWFGAIKQAAVTYQPGLYAIANFVDGDTIAVDMDGKVETIRFVGVDTPETHKPNTPVQCFGPEAAAFTKAQIGSGRVRLASDPYSTNRDRYDRLLRYVYLQDGTLLNEKLIQSGYGFYYPYFPFAKSDQFNADEQAAIKGNLGLWARCHPTPSDGGGYKMDETAAQAGA